MSGHTDFVEIVTNDITHKYSIFIVASNEFFSHKLKPGNLSPVSNDGVGGGGEMAGGGHTLLSRSTFITT